ncbi:hypothetical protein ISN45_Aa06g008420 [Arabidopsis thaliana x Arabidopsis arenosa]|uniref:Uncharacterized protein n=1 Tax=Arabidopsis thaliana x Arabidopsis arenosa TaxID=1240361 RepID=A0A8T1YW60_9BRAS|nr:hypothetical protein ISN45_Aa06g008420 [Arabidopsis thaliana x Arabidopsis arenosa]
MGGEKRKSSFKNLANAKKRRSGPHLPSSILKTIANEKRPLNSDEGDDEIDSDYGDDLYEYEEGVPEEESRKNNRYDRVDNYEFELPQDFEDENVESEDDDDDDRHTRMLQDVTGLPIAAFQGESKSKRVVFTEPYPESEFNPTRDVLEGISLTTIDDLMEPLQGLPGYSQLSNMIFRMRKDTQSLVHAPLTKPEREKLERNVVKELVDKVFNNWVPLVKRNREAPTVYFNEDVNVGYSTVGAIASQFQPRTEFEMKMASLLDDNDIWEAHKEDGARLLEFNEASFVSMEDHIKRRNHVAKMRSMLFRVDLKSKRIKKIKSKTYHRLKNKDLNKSGVGAFMDPEMAKEEAKKQEVRRVKERMTLKHKNAGPWAKRMLRLGLDRKYDGTRAAIAEQLQINATLSRKMNSTKDESSSDEEDLNDGSYQDTCKLIAEAKENTLKILEDDEVPISGLMSLPFMARAVKKKNEEAKREHEKYEEFENSGGAETSKKSTNVGGRRVFGAEAPKESKMESDNFFDNSDSSDNDMDDNELEAVKDNASPARNTKTIMETEKETKDEESDDSESEAEQMVDGILTCCSKETYEIPFQEELVSRAFAGDDVVGEFDKDKQEVLNQEVPEPEKPVQVPGWGHWTNTQNKRDLPSRMVREHEDAKKTREQALKKRKDASLRHVILSEKVDKKAEKLHTTSLPYPYTSKEVFEHSMRMPIGPEFNPTTIVGDLNRPEVVKKAGMIIKPVKFEEVDPNEKVEDEHARSHQKQKPKKGRK